MQLEVVLDTSKLPDKLAVHVMSPPFVELFGIYHVWTEVCHQNQMQFFVANLLRIVFADFTVNLYQSEFPILKSKQHLLFLAKAR